MISFQFYFPRSGYVHLPHIILLHNLARLSCPRERRFLNWCEVIRGAMWRKHRLRRAWAGKTLHHRLISRHSQKVVIAKVPQYLRKDQV